MKGRGGGRRRKPRRWWWTTRRRSRRGRSIRAGRVLGLLVVLIAFASGIYLAQLYGEISLLIAARRGALSSAIYSAPLVIRPGEDVVKLRLIDRLAHLSYAKKARITRPGEYAFRPGQIALYLRGFRVGVTDYPALRVRLSLDGERVSGIADAFGVARSEAMLEPEVIGRLYSGMPVGKVEARLVNQKPYLTGGLLAVEDSRFYYHPGIDPIRIVKAAWIDWKSGRFEQGASTITQQLARTFLARRERTFSRKLKELAVAIVLELKLSKDRILESFIDDVQMGDYEGTPIVGLPLAARYLFNRDLSQVTPAEAAMLIGMIRAPTLYDPRRHPGRALKRRNLVLRVMRRARVIDEAQYRRALATPLRLARPPGLRRAPYFSDYVTSFVRHIPGFDGELRGVKVYTTLDAEMQAAARRAVVGNLRRLEKHHRRLRRHRSTGPLEGTLVAIDAPSGAIRAMVGGRDYARSQYNRAALAQRQVGSAFKPIVYLAALDPARAPFSPALTLASTLPDRPMSFRGWRPANYGHVYRGRVTVGEALIESLNVPTAYVGSLLGPHRIIRTAHELGIGEKLPAVAPLAIGAGETTLLELTGAYQVLADEGVASRPYGVEAVVDGRGHLIYHHTAAPRRVVRRPVAYLITGALEAVLKAGTGRGAARMGLDFPAAGKTGTTDDYRDAYFVGYTPKIVCGVWVGFDRPASIGLPGARAALPAWVDFMKEAAWSRPRGFRRPPGVTMATIDPMSGGLATTDCPQVLRLPFLRGTEPRRLCTLHGGLFASARETPSPAQPATVAEAGRPAAQGVAPAPPAPPPGVIGALGRLIGSLLGP